MPEKKSSLFYFILGVGVWVWCIGHGKKACNQPAYLQKQVLWKICT